MHDSIAVLSGHYERLTNAALAGEPDMVAISELYDDAFVGSSPAGVMAGKRDDAFQQALATGFQHNRKIGARQMKLVGTRVACIDTIHAMVHVDWRASYDKDGMQKAIAFTNVYLIRVTNGQARVFGWITGDEHAELQKHGII